MKSIHCPCPKQNDLEGFTLVEMLVVMAIAAMLMGLAVPATQSILRASQVTTATQMVIDELSTARQTALGQNRVIEVRFYEFESTERGTGKEISAFESLIYDETNTTPSPLGSVKHFPDAAVFSADSKYSPVLQPARQKTWTAKDPQRELARGVGRDYTAYAIRFRPDGSTDLPKNAAWHITIHGSQDKGSPPANHSTIQIDPRNGSLRLYRPG